MLRLPLAVSVVMLSACTYDSAEARTQIVEVNDWVVAVSVQPFTFFSPIAISVGDVRPAPIDSSAWISLELNLENRGDLLAVFDDDKTAAFVRRSGEPVLLVADVGCGYAHERRLVAPVCTLSLAPYAVRPHSVVTRGMSVYAELTGMGELDEGTYAFSKGVRFRVGDRVYTGSVRLTFEIRQAGIA